MANEFKAKKGLIVQGSGSTVLDIQGSQGQLFSVTDSLSGSLFSVNDISGMPIMEVFSDDKVLLGTFNAEAIKVSGSTANITGSLFGTSSWAVSASWAPVATTAATASFVTASNVYGPFGSNSILSSSFAVSASWAPTNISSSITNNVNKYILTATGGSTVNGEQYFQFDGDLLYLQGRHQEGGNNQANGTYSHAEGDFTQAIGNYSHAEGQETIASGSYSHAEGYQTIASANHQHVQGQFNATSSVPAAFIVGNGTDNSNRSNLIYAAGNEVQISGSVKVFGSITGSLFGTASWAQNAVTASYVAAANVAGLSLFQITTGSITASVGIGPNDLFLIKSGSVQYFNISSSGNTTINSNLFIIKNFTTQQPVLTVSQSIVQFATQSSAPTGSIENGSIWFTSTNFYVGLD